MGSEKHLRIGPKRLHVWTGPDGNDGWTTVLADASTERDGLVPKWYVHPDIYFDDIESKEAEIARLRAALEKAHTFCKERHDDGFPRECGCEFCRLRTAIDAALSPPKDLHER